MSSSTLNETAAAGSASASGTSSSSSPKAGSNDATDDRNNETRPQYYVASHSVAISKFGYTLDPQDLKFPEIIMSRPAESRRNSILSFDSDQVGHRMLDLIRGFWSQVGFPSGQLATDVPESNVNAIIDRFARRPFFPHQSNRGRMSRASRSMSPIARSHRSISPIYDPHPASSSTSPSSSLAANQPGHASSPPSSPGSPSPSSGGPFAMSSPRTTPLTAGLSASSGIRRTLSPSIGHDFHLVSVSPPPATTSATRSKSPARLPHVLADLAKGANQTSGGPSGQQAKPANQEESTTTNDNQAAGSLFSMFIHKSKSNKSRVSSSPQARAPDHFTSWIPRDKTSIYDLIMKLFRKMHPIFVDEDRVVKIQSPCLVLGDIHGNLSDLRTYEHTLWPKAPHCCTKNHLFLGDYVDRGDYSVECILYLFAMKSLAPERFILLRGNHEVAAIQRQYTFLHECELKFGAQLGQRIWREMNKIFDVMPLAAIIDEHIFCAHGGIPRSIGDVQRLIDEIPCPLDNPEVQCPAAWEILWNDPITDQELVAMIEIDNATSVHTSSAATSHNDQNPGQQALANALTKYPSDTSSVASASPHEIMSDGFMANIKRGTAYLFSDQAIERFLKSNKLSHVIRAHEVIPTGFTFHGDGRVITIFSSSRYCGLENQAAAVLVSNNLIRILRLDTGPELD